MNRYQAGSIQIDCGSSCETSCEGDDCIAVWPSGQAIALSLADILALAESGMGTIGLDRINTKVSGDPRNASAHPYFRTTGVRLFVSLVYDNRYDESGRPRCCCEQRSSHLLS